MKTLGDTDGYSLLEMLVVLSIVSLVSGVLFAYTARHRETLDSLGQKTARTAQEASLTALTRAEITRVLVDVSKLTVKSDRSREGIVMPPGVKLAVLTGAELIESTGVGVIEFYDDGTSSGGEITFEDGAGNFVSVRIHWLTGAVAVRKGSRS
jgi:general secretion pathway protein H